LPGYVTCSEEEPLEAETGNALSSGMEVRFSSDGIQGHDAWSFAYGVESDLFTWLLSKRRSNRGLVLSTQGRSVDGIQTPEAEDSSCLGILPQLANGKVSSQPPQRKGRWCIFGCFGAKRKEKSLTCKIDTG